jgi:hypothetical protein
MKRKIILALVSLASLVLLAIICFWIYAEFIWISPGFDRSKNIISANIFNVLTNSENFTLYSIEGSDIGENKEWKGEVFHGFPVLGKTEIKNTANRLELVSSLGKSVKDSRGIVASCFMPRHGIRSIQGTNLVDVVICFKCLSIEIYTSSTNTISKELLITSSAQSVFERAVKSANLPVESN